MPRNRIIYGSQSVWCNGEVLYRVQTLGSTTTFTSEDIFELGHLDIIDVVDDVPAVAVTLNTNDWGDVKTMAILAQVATAKMAMSATATNTNANLAVVSGTQLTEVTGEGYYLHGACIADFAIVCGNLPGVSIWAPVQNECDLGTLAEDIEQSLYMDEVFVNSLEFSYSTGANATENYGAETDQKMWLLNDGKYINWEEFDDTTFSGTYVDFSTASGVQVVTLSDGTPGFLRTDDDGYRAVTVYDDSAGTMVNWRVATGTSANAAYFVYYYMPDGTSRLFKPTSLTIASNDIVYSAYAANGFGSATTSSYFNALDDSARASDIGAIRQGQVEIYIVDDSDSSYANAWRLTGVTITSDLTREPLTELGHLGPYDRPLTLPVPITVTVDTTAGDLENWAKFAGKTWNDTLDDINLSDLMDKDDLKLVVKIFQQTDETAGGTGSARTVATDGDLIGDTFFNNGVLNNGGAVYAAGVREYALKTLVVEHLKITDESYTLDLGTNATQTFGFRSTNDLYVIKGDLAIEKLTSGKKIRRNG